MEHLGFDEFGEIGRLFRPLTNGAPEALGLLDDAAILTPPPGEALIVTTDTMVAGVHFLSDTPPELVAKKLLRVNLSDLAAKGAEPWGWFLTVAWPQTYDAAARRAFAAGLAEDQTRYGLTLWGGDTVSTPGPLTVGATLVGRAPVGAAVTRSGARAGDVVLVSGTIGDAGLGLEALGGALPDLNAAERDAVVLHHRLPEPRLALRGSLRGFASAAADVSDGLLADAGRIGIASGMGVEIDLHAVPLSLTAARWLARQGDEAAGRVRLATAGDDYEVVCTTPPGRVDPFCASAQAVGVALTPIGRMVEGAGVLALFHGRPAPVERLGWTHG